MFRFTIEIPIILQGNYDDNNMCWIWDFQYFCFCQDSLLFRIGKHKCHSNCRKILVQFRGTTDKWLSIPLSYHPMIPIICEIQFTGSQKNCRENLATFAQRLGTNNSKMVLSFGEKVLPFSSHSAAWLTYSNTGNSCVHILGIVLSELGENFSIKSDLSSSVDEKVETSFSWGTSLAICLEISW